MINKKAKSKDIKKISSKKIVSSFVVIFMGYVFFFTSRAWMPPSNVDVEITELNVPQSVGEDTFLVYEWVYSKEEKTMFIALAFVNQDVNIVQKEITFNAFTLDKTLVLDVLKSTDKYYFLKISEVPKKWDAVALEISISGKNVFQTNSEVSNSRRLYNTYNNIKKVDTILSYDDNEYEKLYYTYQINFLGQEIDELIKKNEENYKAIEEYKATKDLLVKENSDLLLEEEENERQTKISTLDTSIKNLETSITNNDSKVATLNEKIESLQKYTKDD